MQQIDLEPSTPAAHGLAAIAHETQQSLTLVQRLYAEEMQVLARQAKFTQFLDVLALRRVRQRLRRH